MLEPTKSLLLSEKKRMAGNMINRGKYVANHRQFLRIHTDLNAVKVVVCQIYVLFLVCYLYR